MEEERNPDVTDSARRSFMKKGALATSGLALGLAGSGAVAADGSDVAESAADADLQAEEGLVFAYDFWPEIPFVVVDQLQTSTTVSILSGPSGEGIPEISQPDDWNAYVVNYRMQQGGPGLFTLVFTEANLQSGNHYQFGGDAQVFSTAINLLSGTVSSTNNQSSQ